MDYIDRPGSHVRSSYSRTLDLWGEFFPDDRLLVLFYEDLMANPSEFLNRICCFLNVEFAGHFCDQTIAARIQETADRALPPQVVRHAALACSKEIDRLAERFGGPALGWQRSMEELMQ